jgi:hypothetical protein
VPTNAESVGRCRDNEGPTDLRPLAAFFVDWHALVGLLALWSGLLSGRVGDRRGGVQAALGRIRRCRLRARVGFAIAPFPAPAMSVIEKFEGDRIKKMEGPTKIRTASLRPRPRAGWPGRVPYRHAGRRAVAGRGE